MCCGGGATNEAEYFIIYTHHSMIRLTGGAASVVARFSRAPQIQSSNLLTDMEIITTDDHNWYSKQPSQH